MDIKIVLFVIFKYFLDWPGATCYFTLDLPYITYMVNPYILYIDKFSLILV